MTNIYRKRAFKFWVVTIGWCIVMCADAYGSPRMNYPGTRAKGMGMAFTAVADDSSAVWYNPAGLVAGRVAGNEGFDLIIEGGEVIHKDLDSKKSYFFAISGPVGSKSVLAISHFCPHILGYTSNGFYGYADITPAIKDYKITSIGLAYPLSPSLRIGGVIEAIRLKADSGTPYRSLSFTSGVHWMPVDIHQYGLKVQLGATYRSKSNLDIEVEIYNKPESWNFGIAVMKSLTTIPSAFTLSAQYEKTDFSKSSGYDIEYDTFLVGMEWQLVIHDMGISRLALRAGGYTEAPKGGGVVEVNGKTCGLGLLFGIGPGSWGLEYAVEWRNLSHQENLNSDRITLHTLAITFSL